MERTEKKGSNRVTSQQLSRMISHLESAPHIPNNAVKGPQTTFWRKVAKELNEMGPIVRDPSTWKRVWFDYKFSVKKRARQYNESLAKSGYPIQLSQLHRRVIKLLNLEIKNANIKAEDDSGSEDVMSEETNSFKDNTFNAVDQTDSMVPASIMHDGSDDNTNPLPTRISTRAINACQKRLEKLPNITITKQKNDTDPLANGGNSYSGEEESNPAPFESSRKRSRDAMFRKALDTNKAMLAAMNASLTSNKELTAELRTLKQSCDELNENFMNVNSTLRELIDALKNK
uniref:Myb_DNA-bind_5 domain-containing protein n=1 Tax=Anopheles minimus TaxID=112268 RepID=A0A182WI17_9DIPT